MAERSLAVSLVIGGAIAPSLVRALKGAEKSGVRSGLNVAEGLKKAKVGQTLAADVIKYRTTLDSLKAKQTQLGASGARLSQGIAEVQRRYSEAKTAAKAYGLTIKDITKEHRDLTRAVALSERRLARQDARTRNRDTRSQVQSEIVTAAAPALLLAEPLKQAIQFESTLADINKVIDFKAPDGLKRLGDDILRLGTAERIPMAVEGLGAIVVAAGQAGIARKELVQFTRDAAKIGVAFDISGQEAGAAMSGLRSIFSVNQKQAVLIADSYNHLSNNMDATAAQILRVANRAGSLGKLVGFSGQQVGALAATFLALKTPPEVAATGINALMTRLATADKQPARFGKALRTIGLSAKGLKNAMKKDAQGALINFLERVDKSKDKIGLLADLFGAEYADDIAKLVGSLDVYKKSLGLVGDQTKFAGSAQKEYEARAKTTANDLVILKNQASKLAIVTGSLLLPGLKSAVSVLESGVGVVTVLAERFPTLTKVIGFATVALVALKIATLGAKFGATLMSDAYHGVRGALDLLHPVALKNTAAMVRMRAASMLGGQGITSLATTAVPLLITSLKGLTLASMFNPITLGILAIAAGAALIIKFWQPIKTFFVGVWSGIKEALGPETMGLFRELGTVFGWIGSLVKSLVAPFNASKESMDGVRGAGEAIGRVIGGLINVVKALLNPLDSLSEKWASIKSLWGSANLAENGKAAMATVASGIKAGGKSVIGAIKGVFGQVDDHLPKSDAKVGPLSNLTASGMALVHTLGQGVRAGSAALTGPLGDVLGAAPAGPGFQFAGAGAAGGGGGGITIDMSGMTIHANTASDAQAIGDALEAKIRKVVEGLDRRKGQSRRGNLHDGDSGELAL